MDTNTISECRAFVQDRRLQRQALVMDLKLQLAQGRRFEEVGRKLGELKPFIEYFYRDMIDKFGSAPAFYEYCGISRQVYANMQRDDYDPKINTVYKILIGLKLNLLDATILLENAGYTFTYKSTQQLIIIFCLHRRIYNPMDVDALLVDQGENALFAV